MPMAAEPPQPPASSSLPSQPSPTARLHPRSCWGSRAGQGHWQPPPTPLQLVASPSTGNRTPAGGSHDSMLCWQQGIPAPHRAPHKQPPCLGAGGWGQGCSSPSDAAAGPQCLVLGSHEPN